MRIVKTENWTELADWLLTKIFSLHHAGAEFAAIASNSPHRVFDLIQKKSPIPLLSIVEETCAKAQEMELKKIGLMGTQLTMEADFYKRPFQAHGITVVVPGREEQQLIHHKLFSEIELGIFKDSTRKELLTITKRMADEEGIEALILGCTELPLLLTESKFGIPFLNTTAIHCEGIVTCCISD